jgi:tripartite-type tricarboxylate transporter receptor subunit TctC
MQDLIGGQIDFFLAPYGKNSDELAKQGRIKLLAMLNAKRLDGVKDYPAITESKGLKGFTYSIWTGYFVKKDTPEPIAQTLNKALGEVLEDPTVRSSLDANSLLIAKPLSLNELSKVYGDGAAQFRAIAKSINLQPQ